MPNHFTTILTCCRAWEVIEKDPENEKSLDEINADLAENNLCFIANPRPEEYEDTTSPCPESEVKLQEELYRKYGAHNWYDWSNLNWGTKWGTYDQECYSIGGDGGVHILKFQSAWGPPNENAMSNIIQYIYDNYALEVKGLQYFDPCDKSCTSAEFISPETVEYEDV